MGLSQLVFSQQASSFINITDGLVNNEVTLSFMIKMDSFGLELGVDCNVLMDIK